MENVKKTIEQSLSEKIQKLPLAQQKKLLASAERATLEMQTLPTVETVPIGTILAYGGLVGASQEESLYNAGWLVCDGSEMPRDDYADLFSVIGIAYGAGDGYSSFNLPDLRGRFVRGVDGGTKRDPDADSRTASGTDGFTGDEVGSLQEDQYQKHRHQTYMNNGAQAEGSDGGREGKYDDYPSLYTDYSGTCDETRPKNIYVNWIIKAQNVNQEGVGNSSP